MHQGIRVIIAVVLLCGLTACRDGLITTSAVSGLQKAAADYYNFSVGNLPGREYTSFFSPAYRASFTKEDLARLNEGRGTSNAGNNRIQKLKPSDIIVSDEANFAMTDVPPRLGFAYESMDPIRWVRVGSRWYIYMGSDKEVSDYGYFPVTIPYPVIPEELPAQVQEDKQRKPQPVDPAIGTDEAVDDTAGNG